jgi:hypothetical protein
MSKPKLLEQLQWSFFYEKELNKPCHFYMRFGCRFLKTKAIYLSEIKRRLKWYKNQCLASSIWAERTGSEIGSNDPFYRNWVKKTMNSVIALAHSHARRVQARDRSREIQIFLTFLQKNSK